MIRPSDKVKLEQAYLKLQYRKLLARYERQKKRDAFIRSNLKSITPLSMDGWPRLKNMKDYLPWIDLVYRAKIEGIYSIGTANCDVIAQLNRFAKDIQKATKK